MAHIHSKAIIHGDLTPTNILLKVDQARPSRLVAKIADFGLCATMTPGKTHISNIRNGVCSFGIRMWSTKERCQAGGMHGQVEAGLPDVLVWHDVAALTLIQNIARPACKFICESQVPVALVLHPLHAAQARLSTRHLRL